MGRRFEATENRRLTASAMMAGCLVASPMGPAGAALVLRCGFDLVGLLLAVGVFALAFAAVLRVDSSAGTLPCIVAIALHMAACLGLAVCESGWLAGVLLVGVSIAAGSSSALLGRRTALMVREDVRSSRFWTTLVAALGTEIVFSGAVLVAVPGPGAPVILVEVLCLLTAGSAFASERFRTSADSVEPSADMEPLAMRPAIVAHFLVFGGGCSLYAGTAVVMGVSSATGAPLLGPCGTAFVIGVLVAFVADLVVYRLAGRGRYGLSYGYVARLFPPVLSVMIILTVTLLIYMPVVGSFLLAVPPVISLPSLGIMLAQMCERTGANLAATLVRATGIAALGVVLGLGALACLLLVHDLYLQLQILCMILVLTCTFSVPGLPRKSGTGADMLQRVLPEDAPPQARAESAATALARMHGLTPREERILILMAENLSPSEIAQELGIALKTVQNHTSHIYEKLGAHSSRDVSRMLVELE